MKEGWKMTKLKEVCTITSGQSAPQGDESYSLVGTPFIKAGNLLDLTNGLSENAIQQIEENVASAHKLTLYPKGSVVFAKSGMSCLKGHIYTLKHNCYVVSHLAVLIPNDKIISSYLNYVLKLYQPSSLAADAAFPSIKLSELGLFSIPVPSLSEQQRIVDILDDEFAKIDALKEKAEKNLQNAKDLFQAVLRRELYSTYTQPLVDVCLGIVDCPHSTPKKSTKKTEYPCIRTSELGKGEILWSTMQYVDEDEYLKRIGRMIPQYEDIVYGREGTIGNAVLIPKEHNFCLGQRTTMFRPNKDIVDPKYLLYAILSPYVYDQAMIKNNGCGVAHVNVADIKQFRIPMKRTIAEQQRVVGVLDRLNTNCKILNENFLKTMILCDDLKQALLRKAFNGEL